ncbi:MAG: hypothetical protein GY769_06680 [bacterium]|nr:hypothetical protein [bacterium]
MSEAETQPTSEAPPPPPPPPSSGDSASSNRGLMIALSYLWLLALIPLLVEKDDAEVQWHAKHGLTLLVAEVILWIVFAVLSMVLGPLACVLAIVQLVLFIAIIVVHIICIVKGVNGERFLIPGVSQYADRF